MIGDVVQTLCPVLGTNVSPLIGLRLPVAAAMWAEVLGVLFAWLSVRRTDVWKKRPKDTKGLELLAAYVAKVTGLAALLGLIAAGAALLAGNA
jgi:hypothetical protein